MGLDFENAGSDGRASGEDESAHGETTGFLQKIADIVAEINNLPAREEIQKAVEDTKATLRQACARLVDMLRPFGVQTKWGFKYDSARVKIRDDFVQVCGVYIVSRYGNDIAIDSLIHATYILVDEVIRNIRKTRDVPSELRRKIRQLAEAAGLEVKFETISR